MRLAVLSSHPIQYQAPLFRRLAIRLNGALEVFFCHEHGVRPSFDHGFGRVIQYDVPLTEGYRHRFLRNLAPHPSLTFRGQISPEIVPLLARGGFDAVVVHGYASVTNLLAILGRWRHRPRVLLRGDSSILLRPAARSRRVAKQLLLRPLFRRVDHFLAAGTANRRYYESFGVPPERITLAPYSVDNEYFAARSEAARLDPATYRARHGLPQGRPLFVFCGKLIPLKRPFDLLHAFAVARRQAPCGLAIIGDGELTDAVRAEVARLGLADDVKLLGFRNQSEIPELFGCADALVLPSMIEAWGLVMNEAMACGLALTASDRVGGAGDLIQDNGAIFPTGDVQALGAILSEWATTPSLLERHKRASLARIQDWSMERTVDGFVAGVHAALAS
jgi:glycosyltransferase involved in cell wall biosynthesis